MGNPEVSIFEIYNAVEKALSHLVLLEKISYRPPGRHARLRLQQYINSLSFDLEVKPSKPAAAESQALAAYDAALPPSFGL